MYREDIEIEVDGVVYIVPCFLDGDDAYYSMPDGGQRMTTLRGLSIEAAARPHLMGYLRMKRIKEQESNSN